MTVTVHIPETLREEATAISAGAAYALKTLALQLAEDPRLGNRLGRPGLYQAVIDHEAFDDCPELTISYAYGPPLTALDHVEIRGLEARTPQHAPRPAPAPVHLADPRTGEQAAREVRAAFASITSWLTRNAPATHHSLLPPVAETHLHNLIADLGICIPADLDALWSQCAGQRDEPGTGFLPEHGWALMPLNSVREVYHRQMAWQAEHTGEAPLWKPSWVPFASWTATDTSYGLYLDTETGEIGSWDKTAARTPQARTLTMLLEETADRLSRPTLSPGAQPRVEDGILIWGNSLGA
ncbi:SMI1/KNR4 family protein [Streptomyces sp. NPDC047065]|uniref:SMI1/KNR4 family protein n=1 Tax=Streptomyces sp. NPDC047065 TaxID=3154606 RepID=UPI0033D9A2C3